MKIPMINIHKLINTPNPRKRRSASTSGWKSSSIPEAKEPTPPIAPSKPSQTG